MALFRRKTTKKTTPERQSDQIPREWIDQVPWMGEEPFEASYTSKPPGRILDDLGYVRRILFAWLCGRPVSEMASRAGCSERSVRNVVSEMIYVPEQDLNNGWERWCELGLVGGLLISRENVALGDQSSLRDYKVTVVCQICHRTAGYVYMPAERLENSGLLIENDVLASGILLLGDVHERDLGRIQGHLLCHFLIEIDPIPSAWSSQNFRLRLKLKQYEYLPSKRGLTSHLRQHFSVYVSQHARSVLTGYVSSGSSMLRPIVKGRELSIEGARRRWLKMFNQSR